MEDHECPKSRVKNVQTFSETIPKPDGANMKSTYQSTHQSTQVHTSELDEADTEVIQSVSEIECEGGKGCCQAMGNNKDSQMLSEETIQVHGNCHNSTEEDSLNTILQIQRLTISSPKGERSSVACLWDGGSTLCFITFQLAKKLGLHGIPVKLEIITVGGESKKVESQRYTVTMIDKNNISIPIEVLGIKEISTEIEMIKIDDILHNFRSIKAQKLSRPCSGQIDLLIGLQYAGYHPRCIESVEHLLLMENRFGSIIAGSHPNMQEKTKRIVQHALVLHTSIKMEDFYSIESLGVSCTPTCGACKCGKCHPGAKNMTLAEERELQQIEEGLTFNHDTGRWLAKYPWVKNPSCLLQNRHVAYAILRSTEKRLKRNTLHAETYQRQINDMIERKVARRVSEEELKEYNGQTFYLSHHDVLKPESNSTAMRVVFNSSARINGTSLNDCLAKGPSLLNNMLGILLRFRQDRFAFIGDISKMFHSIDIPYEDQMMHLFLWRNFKSFEKPNTYAITVVNMGDRPSAAIAQTALKKTAELATEEFPEASSLIIDNSYMDDLLGNANSEEKAKVIMKQTESILAEKGFKIKEWILSGQKANTQTTKDQKAVQTLLNKHTEYETEKVLGMEWDTETDSIKFKLKRLNLAKQETTKRECLSTIYSIYDPLGLLAPITIAAKIILRKVWASQPQIDWDDPLPKEIQKDWDSFREILSYIPEVVFERSIKPLNGTLPILIILSDGSKQAYGAAAYIRWCTPNGYVSRLLVAKSRIAPLKIVDPVRLELCAALLNSRLYVFIQREIPQIEFSQVFHIVDSEIVKAMVNKQSYGFNTFAANRIGEIHRNTEPDNWYWIEGELNIADILTREGRNISDISQESIWQNGPEFLKLSTVDWPIFSKTEKRNLPELKKEFVCTTKSNILPTSLASIIDIERFSKLQLLLHTTARLMNLQNKYKKVSNRKKTNDILPSELELAERIWIKKAQEQIQKEIKDSKYKKLHPCIEDDIYVVGGRTERWMESTWNRQKFILLPKDHRLSYLIALRDHEAIGHLAVESTIAKIRSKYWIIGIRRIVSSIISKCVTCKRKFKKLAEQKMSTLPVERLKPCPAFTNVGIDYFGPYATKGEVQKRVRGKGYGVIFTCDVSRAVHLEVVPDYSTQSFLQSLRRFCSVRGWPNKIHSDPGSQLKGAASELRRTVQGLDWEEIRRYGHKYGTTWSFAPGDAQWYNGSTEALVKTTKRALKAIIGDHIFKFSELLTIMYEISQIVNQRPIGRKPTEPHESPYLCPNDLLLGRCTSHVPQGPFSDNVSEGQRYKFIQSVINSFWKRWTREVFPGLVIQPKWHVDRRNVLVGDVVLVQDSNIVRGEWKMGLITKTIPSSDTRIRRVEVMYKRGSTRITVSRAVQRLIILVPKEENNDQDENIFEDEETIN